MCLATAHGQAASACSDQNVEYRRAPESIQKKIQLTTSATLAEVPRSAKRKSSPQGTRWFVELDPDYTSTKDPWTTVLYINSGREDKGVLKVVIADHGNTFSASWINEKLLFIQVWWGRMASSDLILDTNQGTFIYDELAHYGELSEPCE